MRAPSVVEEMKPYKTVYSKSEETVTIIFNGISTTVGPTGLVVDQSVTDSAKAAAVSAAYFDDDE